jgi:hypothetical protein
VPLNRRLGNLRWEYCLTPVGAQRLAPTQVSWTGGKRIPFRALPVLVETRHEHRVGAQFDVVETAVAVARHCTGNAYMVEENRGSLDVGGQRAGSAERLEGTVVARIDQHRFERDRRAVDAVSERNKIDGDAAAVAGLEVRGDCRREREIAAADCDALLPAVDGRFDEKIAGTRAAGCRIADRRIPIDDASAGGG